MRGPSKSWCGPRRIRVGRWHVFHTLGNHMMFSATKPNCFAHRASLFCKKNFGGRSLEAVELDCCSDCIYSLRERNSELYDGKSSKNSLKTWRRKNLSLILSQTKVGWVIAHIGSAETLVRSTKISEGLKLRKAASPALSGPALPCPIFVLSNTGQNREDQVGSARPLCF